jgi:hypothetical protein
MTGRSLLQLIREAAEASVVPVRVTPFDDQVLPLRVAEFGGQRGQFIELIPCPAVLDCNVPSLDETGFA